MKNLFINKTSMDNNHSTDHYRLSEPTFRHGNFLSRSESTDSAAVRGAHQQAKACSLDYRSNNNNNPNLTGDGHQHQQIGVKKVKCVFLGDARSGKTSLIVSYTTNGYPQNYAPTAFDNFSVLVKVDNQPVQLQICDTAGQAGFDNLRPLCFPNADVFVLCFSVVDPDSFYNLHNKWLPEIRKFFNDDHADDNENVASSTNNGKKAPPVKTPPILLIGTQSDRRTNVSIILDLSQLGETVIKKEEALEYAQEIGALAYIECSALTQHNLKEVFDACILSSLNMPCGDAADVNKSKIEKARNQYSQEFVNPNAASSGVARKSFKKIKEKMKRSNSVDSAKYASVQVRRQLSSGRINHLGLQNAALAVADQSKDQLAPSNQEKPTMKKISTTADGAIPSSSAPVHQHNNNVENKTKNSNKNDSSAVISPTKVKKPSKISSSSLSSSVPQSPSNSKLVKFSMLKSKMSNNFISGQQNNKNDQFGSGGRKMSSKSFDSFSCGNATPKILPKRKLSTKIMMNGNNEGIHGARNNDMMQEIDKLKKGWRKLLCMT